MKPFDGEALLSAIRNAIDLSRHALDDELEMRMLRDRYSCLSRREKEVMALVVAGKLTSQGLRP
jgi:FixJ family two-component response regulator